MSLPEKIGIESRLDSYLPEQGLIRAKFRIDNSEAPLEERFADGDWLDVSITARVFDPAEIQRRHGVPDEPLAQGAEVRTRARTDWAVVDLPLPALAPGQYAVVAKVFSADEKHRKPFSPSNCYVSLVDLA